MRRLRIYVGVFTVFLTVMCISACASNENPRIGSRGRAQAIIGKGTNRIYRYGSGYSIQPSGSPAMAATQAASTASSEERSQKIAQAVTGLSAIKSASVVITGNTAIVGVQIDSKYSDTELIDIKRIVEEKVKAMDKGIDHVSVTTAIDIVGRINRMPDAGSSEDPPLDGHDIAPRTGR